ncbi:MAG: J domain-containing protein [Gammaproteobacteria bacterium]|nr:J domain-containing protein [Gammaproteobacteria bacterium]
MQAKIAEFNRDCDAIIGAKKDTDYCLHLFELESSDRSLEHINQAFKQLSLKYNPDKNPFARKKAETVQKLLGDMRNHLLTDEPLEQSTISSSIRPRYNIFLDELGVKVLMGQPIDIELLYLDNLVTENSKYLWTVGDLFFTPLRYAIYAKDFDLFERWRQLEPDALFYAPYEVGLSPLHYLIRMSAEEHQTDDVSNMLLSLKMDGVLTEAVCRHSLTTLHAAPDVLNFFILELLDRHKVQLDFPQLTRENPFIAATEHVKRLFSNEERRDAFMGERISRYPDLYYYLSPEAKVSADYIRAYFDYYIQADQAFLLQSFIEDLLKNEFVSGSIISGCLELSEDIFYTRDAKFDFIIRHMNDCSKLYDNLTEAEQKKPEAILALYHAAVSTGSDPQKCRISLGQHLSKANLLSTYFIVALSRCLPEIELNGTDAEKYRKTLAYMSLGKMYQRSLVLVTGLIGGALGLGLVSAAVTPYAVIAMVVLLALIAKAIHAEVKTYQAKTELNALLTKYNHFKPTVAASENTVSAASSRFERVGH